MSTVRCPRYSLYWEETECLSYYDMLSLHEIFEIVGSQLTEADVEVLSFLLDEAYPGRHPLDPVGWTEEVSPGSDLPLNAPCPWLLEAWRRIRPRGDQCLTSSHNRPKSGTELLLELERRGFLHEGNLEPLLQLLRILTRHDLLPFVSNKKRRTVSPERKPVNFADRKVGGPMHTSSHTELASLENTHASPCRMGVGSAVASNAHSRRKRGRGRGVTRRSKSTARLVPQPTPNKVTCAG